MWLLSGLPFPLRLVVLVGTPVALGLAGPGCVPVLRSRIPFYDYGWWPVSQYAQFPPETALGCATSRWPHHMWRSGAALVALGLCPRSVGRTCYLGAQDRVGALRGDVRRRVYVALVGVFPAGGAVDEHLCRDVVFVFVEGRVVGKQQATVLVTARPCPRRTCRNLRCGCRTACLRRRTASGATRR